MAVVTNAVAPDAETAVTMVYGYNDYGVAVLARKVNGGTDGLVECQKLIGHSSGVIGMSRPVNL